MPASALLKTGAGAGCRLCATRAIGAVRVLYEVKEPPWLRRPHIAPCRHRRPATAWLGYGTTGCEGLALAPRPHGAGGRRNPEPYAEHKASQALCVAARLRRAHQGRRDLSPLARCGLRPAPPRTLTFYALLPAPCTMHPAPAPASCTRTLQPWAPQGLTGERCTE